MNCTMPATGWIRIAKKRQRNPYVGGKLRHPYMRTTPVDQTRLGGKNQDVAANQPRRFGR